MKCIYVVVMLALLLTACGKYIQSDIPYGKSFGVVEIRSVPTSAMIYIDGAQVSATPFTMNLSYEGSEKITVTAMPMYAGQNRQEIYIQTPDVPGLITFDMSIKEAADLSDIEGVEDMLEAGKRNSGVVEDSVDDYLQGRGAE